MPPKLSLSQKHHAFRERVRRIARERVDPRGDEIDRSNDFPWDLVEAFKKEGLLNILVPREYGGPGLDYTSTALLAEEVAYGSGGFACFLLTNTFAPMMVALYGTEEQRQSYLPRFAQGAIGNLVAITEHHAGSDMAAMATSAELRDGHWVLNGDKYYGEPLEVAEIIYIFAKTLPQKGSRGISCFVMERDTPGLSVGRKADSLGFRGAGLAQIMLQGVTVSRENLIGSEGEGIRICRGLMDRVAATNSVPVGLAQRAYDLALEHARQRVTFGQPIIGHQSVMFGLVEMAMKIEAARSLIYRACALADGDEADAALSQMASTFANDACQAVGNEAIQVFGGHANLDWHHPASRALRDLKTAATGGGGARNIRLSIIGRGLFA
jgi:alkylation response protein AidB-like acyl-CoA dehydrogenase